MNIFIIPSWYPHSSNPTSGIFFLEQALAIGDLRPEWKVAISLWGQEEFSLPICHPTIFTKRLLKYSRSYQGYKNKLSINVIEYKRPVLTWNYKIFHGNLKNILKANRLNLFHAIEDFGRIDLIHAHVSYPAGWVAMHLSREMNIPYIITEHMGPFPFPLYLNKDGTLKSIIREPLEKAHERIAVSPFLSDCIQKFGIKRPLIIPNLVNETMFKITDKDKKRNKFIFFTLGSMITEKGIVDLLMAIKFFIGLIPPTERNNVEFRIGGDGPRLDDFKCYASELQIQSRVKWLGKLGRSDVLSELENCDCFVLPSHYETFGVVYTEAIACGKPIIATKCGGPEYIVTEENGLLVDVSEPRQLSEALLKMFRTARSYDSKVIREQFLQKFSRAAVVDKLEQIFFDVIGE
jgi:glycosyltransferase involved in cell wall biosynthesis